MTNTNPFLDVPKLPGVVVHDEPIDPSVPPMVRGVKRHYLELPRGITLKRFVNTGRTVKFIGQYNNSENPCNVNPRRIYTIDVEPMWGESEERDPATVKSFEVSCREDGKLLFFERMFETRLSPEDAAALTEVRNLTPGDFRTVRQSLYYLGGGVTNAQRIAALAKESAVKRDTKAPARIGF